MVNLSSILKIKPEYRLFETKNATYRVLITGRKLLQDSNGVLIEVKELTSINPNNLAYSIINKELLSNLVVTDDALYGIVPFNLYYNASHLSIPDILEYFSPNNFSEETKEAIGKYFNHTTSATKTKPMKFKEYLNYVLTLIKVK